MTRRRIPTPSPVPLMAIFAILFQAILFGWHHHELVLTGHLPAAVIENHAGTPQALDDEDGCEICQVLHHLFAAPVDVAASLLSHAPAAYRIAGEPAFTARSPALAFRARAPPSPDAAFG
ncbi:MAG TPA: hypothetical protein VN808_05810 [Stellaceae bacterium]|nr:hypothetical protein [Stellaceae bacterium]